MTANALYTNHVTTFLCRLTTSFADHAISFLEPTFKNSNGRFTTLVILIVTLTPRGQWIKCIKKRISSSFAHFVPADCFPTVKLENICLCNSIF